ncbi:unnamed protein product, partial [Protopolystoma xenopodis]
MKKGPAPTATPEDSRLTETSMLNTITHETVGICVSKAVPSTSSITRGRRKSQRHENLSRPQTCQSGKECTILSSSRLTSRARGEPNGKFVSLESTSQNKKSFGSTSAHALPRTMQLTPGQTVTASSSQLLRPNYKGETVLHRAAIRGDTNQLRRLLEAPN